MTLVSAIPVQTAETQDTMTTEVDGSFTLTSSTTVHPDETHQKVMNPEDIELQELFDQTLRERGEHVEGGYKWVGNNEIQIDGLSGMTLHNFILKAEALGKKITYRRSIVLQITD